MLIGRSCQPPAARSTSQAPAPHSWGDSVTTEALSGGTSVSNASGSDFSRQVLSAPSTWYRYRLPTCTPRTKISQTPREPTDPPAGEKNPPAPGGAERPHGVGRALPVVEVAGDLHAVGAGSPDRERDAL